MKKRSKMQSWYKYVAGLAVLVVVFVAGFAFGGGQLSLGGGAVPANGQLPASLDYTSVNKVYQALKDNYDGKLTVQQLLNGMKHGLAEATGDPHTEYFTPKEAKQFDENLNNEFSGIGAELGKNDNGVLQIVAPLKGDPAEKAGVRAGDLIATINGQDASGMTISQAAIKIRGKRGTKVELGLVRAGKLLNITITRNTINVPSVSWKMLPHKIGYIQIITFADDTSDLAGKAARSLISQGAKSVILDLRGNPGGELNAAVTVSSLWLKQGETVVQERRGPVVVDTYQATGDNPLRGLPTVVLIDGGSASASEITASALHDNGVATLLGTRSYGKGTVQQVENLAGGAELKVTIAKWYRPNGQNIDKKGIKPDKKVKISQQDVSHGRDPQLKAAEQLLAKNG